MCLLDYQDFMNLFEKAKKIEKEEPELAFGIYAKLVKESDALIKECYIGDKNYHVSYKIVEDDKHPLNKKAVLEYMDEDIEKIVKYSRKALNSLETTIQKKVLKESVSN